MKVVVNLCLPCGLNTIQPSLMAKRSHPCFNIASVRSLSNHVSIIFGNWLFILETSGEVILFSSDISLQGSKTFFRTSRGLEVMKWARKQGGQRGTLESPTFFFSNLITSFNTLASTLYYIGPSLVKVVVL
jgi:hypothetical protein